MNATATTNLLHVFNERKSFRRKIVIPTIRHQLVDSLRNCCNQGSQLGMVQHFQVSPAFLPVQSGHILPEAADTNTKDEINIAANQID